MIFNKDKQQTAIKFLVNLLEKGCRVKIERVPEKRSLDQNSLYWLWLTCIQQHTGNSRELLHNHFRSEYLPIQVVKVFGVDQQIPTSTKELNTAQFTQYLNKICEFANTELGIDLPDPETKHFEEFYNQYKDFI